MFGLSKLELNLAIAAALLAGFLGWLWYHDHKIIAAHDAKLEATSAALKAEAQQKIIDLTAKHTAEIADNQGKLSEALKINASLSDTLDARVRQFQAYRASHPGVASTPGGPPAAATGECGSIPCGELAGRSLQDSNDLARSVGELRAVVLAQQRDRDSLTGLPR